MCLKIANSPTIPSKILSKILGKIHRNSMFFQQPRSAPPLLNHYFSDPKEPKCYQSKGIFSRLDEVAFLLVYL